MKFRIRPGPSRIGAGGVLRGEEAESSMRFVNLVRLRYEQLAVVVQKLQMLCYFFDGKDQEIW